jgi:hypothetical protein
MNQRHPGKQASKAATEDAKEQRFCCHELTNELLYKAGRRKRETK